MRTFLRMLAVMIVVLENPVTAQLKGTHLPNGNGARLYYPSSRPAAFIPAFSKYALSFTGSYFQLFAYNVKSFTK